MIASLISPVFSYWCPPLWNSRSNTPLKTRWDWVRVSCLPVQHTHPMPINHCFAMPRSSTERHLAERKRLTGGSLSGRAAVSCWDRRNIATSPSYSQQNQALASPLLWSNLIPHQLLHKPLETALYTSEVVNSVKRTTLRLRSTASGSQLIIRPISSALSPSVYKRALLHILELLELVFAPFRLR